MCKKSTFPDKNCPNSLKIKLIPQNDVPMSPYDYNLEKFASDFLYFAYLNNYSKLKLEKWLRPSISLTHAHKICIINEQREI